MDRKIVIRPEELTGNMPTANGVKRHSSDALLLGSAIAVVLLIVVLGGVLILVNRSGNDESGTNFSESATLTYWNQLQQISSRVNNTGFNTEPDNAQQFVALLQQQQQAVKSAIEEIHQLPTRGVDRDAIEMALQMAHTLAETDALLGSFLRLGRDADDFGSRATSTEKLFESFVRGLCGDPLGTHNELKTEQGQLQDRYQRLFEQAEKLQRETNELRILESRTRAALAERFEIEFPPLD